MDHDEKLEAIKSELDQLFAMSAERDKTMKELAEHINRTFRKFDADISELRRVLSQR
jgi:SMC interacting uncharacterized protein involved in chromosome segregation